MERRAIPTHQTPMPHLSRSQRLGDLALGLFFAAFFYAVITHG